MVNDTQKIERFQKIGFSAAKPIKDAEERFKKQQTASEQIEAIEYYQTYYPSYKFISEEQIQKICKKYGLLYGDSGQYLGDIPEKNLSEIEVFKMREEDFYDGGWLGLNDLVGQHLSMYRRRTGGLETFFTRQYSIGVDPFGSREGTAGWRAERGIMATIAEQGNATTYPPEKKKPPFKICAPQKDFNTAGYEVKDGYKLIYDPIVIQPVKYKNILGGLIISKWGLEGQDGSLVNEISN